VLASRSLQLRSLRAIPRNDERDTNALGSLNRQVDPLVRNESPKVESVPTEPGIGGADGGPARYRGVDHFCISSVHAPDAFGHMLRNRDEITDTLGREPIPTAQWFGHGGQH